MSMSTARTRRASGRWLAPALLTLGVAGGALGVWYMRHARPTPGAYYEVLALDRNTAVALRHEVGSERSFVELVEVGRGAHWQALVPPYMGRADAPGLAASSTAITIRVARDGKEELWALSTNDAEKLGQVVLYAGAARAGAQPPRVVTVADRRQSFELVGDQTHATAVTAIELATGTAKWRVDLGAAAVVSAWLDLDTLWIHPREGAAFGLRRETGARVESAPPEPPAAPESWHHADGVEWVPVGDHLEIRNGIGQVLAKVGGDDTAPGN